MLIKSPFSSSPPCSCSQGGRSPGKQWVKRGTGPRGRVVPSHHSAAAGHQGRPARHVLHLRQRRPRPARLPPVWWALGSWRGRHRSQSWLQLVIISTPGRGLEAAAGRGPAVNEASGKGARRLAATQVCGGSHVGDNCTGPMSGCPFVWWLKYDD